MKLKWIFAAACLVIVVCMALAFASAEEKPEEIKVIELGIYERVVFPSMFPKRASYAQAILVDDMRKRVRLSQEDLKKYEVKTLPGGGVAWNEAGRKYEIEVSLTALELEVLRDELKAMDKRKQVATDERSLALYKEIRKEK